MKKAPGSRLSCSHCREGKLLLISVGIRPLLSAEDGPREEIRKEIRETNPERGSGKHRPVSFRQDGQEADLVLLCRNCTGTTRILIRDGEGGARLLFSGEKAPG